MTESYWTFLDRLDSFEKPELLINDQGLEPQSRLLDKVKDDNSFKDFFGDTVVFDLDIPTKEHISQFIDYLYHYVPECFCERIRSDTLHLTLHDLSNSTNISEIKSQMEYNERELRRRISSCPSKSIQMKTNYVINMVDTSLVLALKPMSEQDYYTIMEYYELIESVFHLEYRFTPHITLGYYNRNGFDKYSVNRLKDVVRFLNAKSFEFSLDSRNLMYQHFISMNDYKTIFHFI